MSTYKRQTGGFEKSKEQQRQPLDQKQKGGIGGTKTGQTDTFKKDKEKGDSQY